MTPYDDLETINLEVKALRICNPQGAEKLVKELLHNSEAIKAITVGFSDIEGRLHMLDYDKEWLLSHCDSLTFDGSSIRGFTDLEQSDLRLEIDWPAFYVLPDDIFGEDKALIFAFVRNRDGTQYSSDFRGRLACLDIGDKTISAAMEIEGFLLDGPNAEQGYSGEFITTSSGGYYNSLPTDPLRQFLDKSAKVQRSLGFQNEKDHPEVAPSQFEMNWSHTDMSIAADQVQLYKIVCRQVANHMNMTASFLPKPITGVNGNGMHVNLSMSDSSGKNLFHDKSSKDGLSDIGACFADGILSRANDICLILNSSVNSYRRLDPDYEAPNQIKRSSIDRGSMIRIPLANEKSARIEVRSVSPDANPYMLLYTLVSCGLSNLERKRYVINISNKRPKEEFCDEDRNTLLHSNIHDAIDNFGAYDIIGKNEAVKYLWLKMLVADRSAKELGKRVKTSEVLFHHEVTNQYIWNKF